MSDLDYSRYARRLLDRFGALPGVEAVGLTGDLPLTVVSFSIDFTADGHEPPQGQDAHRSEFASVDPTYFEAAGIQMVQGRRFRDADAFDAPHVAIISEAMARRFWPDGDAVGRILHVTPRTRDFVWPDSDGDAELRVVGVAGDVPVRSLGEPPALMVYLPYTVELDVSETSTLSPARGGQTILGIKPLDELARAVAAHRWPFDGWGTPGDPAIWFAEIFLSLVHYAEWAERPSIRSSAVCFQ